MSQRTAEYLSAKLINSICQGPPGPGTERMAMESSFMVFLLDNHDMGAVRREQVQSMELCEVVSMVRAWSRAVATGRYVV